MYVGVSGYVRRFQVDLALSQIPIGAERLCMVGVLASQKTIRGHPPGNPNLMPTRENIASIFNKDWFALNLMHYYTKDHQELLFQFEEALRWGGPHCDGLQLNVVWPDPDVVRKVRNMHAGTTLVLQIERNAMEACGNIPERVATRFCESYGTTVDYVLVDPSAGQGIPMIPSEILRYLSALERHRVRTSGTFSLIVAGGLDADNLVRLVGPIRQRFPEIGIDAQKALTIDGGLDHEKVSRYLTTAYTFL